MGGGQKDGWKGGKEIEEKKKKRRTRDRKREKRDREGEVSEEEVSGRQT